MLLADIVLVPLLLYCAFTPSYRPFHFFGAVRKVVLFKASRSGFSEPIHGAFLLLLADSVLVAYYFPVSSSFFSAFAASFGGLLAICAFFHVVMLMWGRGGVGTSWRGSTNLLVFSLFAPLSFAIWLFSKGVYGWICVGVALPLFSLMLFSACRAFMRG